MPESPDAYVNRTYDQTICMRGSLKRRNHPAASGDQRDWPRGLNLKTLARPCRAANPMDEDFDYAKEFLSLDLDQLARDVDQVL
ncbi:MAG: catalase-peroxidase, partial [Mycobacterium sp.]|nr:catalase-peroxidase [Mycobacterium sp.]